MNMRLVEMKLRLEEIKFRFEEMKRDSTNYVNTNAKTYEPATRQNEITNRFKYSKNYKGRVPSVLKTIYVE